MDKVLGCLIGLVRATEGNEHLLTDETARIVRDGLLGADGDILQRIDREKRRLVPMCYDCAAPCGRTNAYDVRKLSRQSEPERSLRLSILQLLRQKAERCPEQLLYRGVYALGMEDWLADDLQPILEQLQAL